MVFASSRPISTRSLPSLGNQTSGTGRSVTQVCYYRFEDRTLHSWKIVYFVEKHPVLAACAADRQRVWLDITCLENDSMICLRPSTQKCTELNNSYI